ncbi:MAG TPA: hypothetical protein VIN58_22280 [Roseateles sp.]
MSLLTQLGFKPKSRVCNDGAQTFARRLVQRLESGLFDDAEQIIAGSAADNRERLVYGLAATEGSVPLVVAWVQARPQSAWAQIALGAGLIVTGWEIRGGSYAEDVDEAAWQPFLSQLAAAEEPLERAMRLDDRLAEPYVWRIHAGLSQDIDRALLSQWFEAALARDPLHGPAHLKYFVSQTEKWGGSHQEMFTFARQCSSQAKAGSLLHALIPAAFNEYALATRDKGFAALRTPANAREVSEALHVWLGARPGQVDEKLERVSGGFAPWCLNEFAAACYLCGADAEARILLQALRGEITPTPWAWLVSGVRERANPAFVYDRVCKELKVAY